MSFSRTLQWIDHLARNDFSDSAKHYDLRGTESLLATHEGTPTMNMGYWKDVKPGSKEGLWDATRALFRLVGENAEINPRDGEVLDAGCGFGTNAVFCAQTFRPRVVHGLNVSQVQLNYAEQLAMTQCQVATKLNFTKGSAVDMPFAAGRFDKVVSVEAAFHFPTRAKFFQEAHRVLKPGGVLSLCDMVPLPPQTAFQRAGLAVLRRGLQIPTENVYGLEVYAQHLREAGFEIERLESIVEHVRPHYRRFIFGRGLHFLTCDVEFLASTSPFFVYPWDYVLVKARKIG